MPVRSGYSAAATSHRPSSSPRTSASARGSTALILLACAAAAAAANGPAPHQRQLPPPTQQPPHEQSPPRHNESFPQAANAPTEENHAWIRGWLMESLFLDVEASKTLYAQIEERVASGENDAVLAHARRIDLTRAAGEPTEALTRALPPAMRAAVAALPRSNSWSIRQDLARARQETDPATKAEKLRRIRGGVLQAERSRTDTQRPASAFALVEPSSTPEPYRPPRLLGFRRDWIEILEHLLEGRLAAAEQKAWLRFNVRPLQIVGNPKTFVVERGNRLARLDGRFANRQDLVGSRERDLLKRLKTWITQRTAAGAYAEVAEVLRRLPMPR